MASKKSGTKTKGSKKQQVINELIALKTNYEANVDVCKNKSIKNSNTSKSIIKQIESKIEEGKPLVKIICDLNCDNQDELCAIIKCIAGYSSLVSMCFWECLITDEVNHLILSNNHDNWKGCKLQHLEIMNIHNNNNEISYFKLKEIELFSNALSCRGCCITNLILDYTNIGNKGFKLLCNGIIRCVNLIHVSMGYCNISSDGIIYFSNLIKKYHSYVNDINHFNVSPLKRFSKLQTLQIHGNDIGECGLKELIKVLHHFETLTHLNISRINITRHNTNIMNELMMVINKLPNISYIEYDYNYIDEDDIKLIIELLNDKKNIKMFKITSRIDVLYHKKICDLLLKNIKNGKKH